MKEQKLLCGIFLASALLSSTLAVDKNNFKDCSESGFCTRQRNYKPKSSPYSVIPDSLVNTAESARFEIRNTDNDVVFVMSLFGYTNGVVRFHMNEKSPLKPRFEVPPGDVVLEDQLHRQQFSVVENTGESFTLSLQQTNTKVKVSGSPLLVEVTEDEQVVLQLNSKGLLKFEHLRQKPGMLSGTAHGALSLGQSVYKWITSPFRSQEAAAPAADDEDAGEGDEENAEGEAAEEQAADDEKEGEKEEHAMWEEKYKTHEDSKPNGPTSIGIDINFVGYQHVFGIPEHGDSFALKSTVGKDPYRLYNLDVFEYDLDTGMALYGSVPVMLAHNSHRTLGVFWNNPSEMWIDISSTTADRSAFGKIADFLSGEEKIPTMETRWMAESGVLDLYYIPGPRPLDVFKQYADLTGTTRLPPLFSIAYHQSRWNYNDEDDVKQIHDNYDSNDIPLDVVWLDIEHTDGKRYFTWDPSRFGSPLTMVADLSARGRKLVTIVDPHIKRDMGGYSVYDDIKNAGFMIKDRNGNEYDGWCWPGSSSYPDFTRPEMRELWAKKFSFDVYKGTTEDVYTWNDMNEPSVFNGPEITMHKDAQHEGGWEHRDVHNLYGMYVHQATAEGQVRRADGNLRPFVLSRAFYAGSQRHGAVWTGDNMGEWSHLAVSIPMMLSQSVTGITFTGSDVGGFFRNPSSELVVRWYQVGAFSPFYRAHSHLDTRRREPWLLGDDNMKIIKRAIETRYALLPYWYTLFYENELTGAPPMRPLWVEFPAEVDLFTEQQQFMLGSAVMARPVTEEGVTGVTVTFPGGLQTAWYDAATYKIHSGSSKTWIPVTLASIPYFYRGGSIVPRKERLRRSTTQMVDDPYTLIVVPDLQGKAAGKLYIDDYKSFKYRQGEFIYRAFDFDGKVLTSKSLHAGSFATKSWLEAVKIAGLKNSPRSVKISSPDGESDLLFAWDAHRSLLTIRKPAVNMGADWSITLG